MGMGAIATRRGSPHGSTSNAAVRVSAAALAASLAASIAATIASCDLPPTFGDEYYDATANFVAARAFAAPSATADSGGSTALGGSGAWDWAWRGQTGNSYEYMTFTADGTAGTPVTDADSGFALASDEPAWRLSLENLAGNPYFEGGSSDGWESIGSAGTAIRVGASAARHGDYLELVSPAPDWAGFDPSFAGFILDGAAVGEFRMAFYAPQAGTKYLVDSLIGVSFSDPKSVIEVDDNKRALEPFSIADADTRGMFAPSSGSQTLEVDDVRIVRHDLKELSSLRLYLAPADTSPSLVPGRYEFSIWVRRPPDALSYADAGRAADPEAEFAATRVTLVMRQVGFIDEAYAPYYFAESFDVGDDWTRLALRMGSGNLARFDEASGEPVLELAVYPFDPIDMDAGSIQIAAPNLRFFVDGYPD